MSKQKDNYALLIEKLDRFIRKFYLNKIIRGTLFTVATITGVFLLYNLLEHQFYFDKGIRKLMFFSFIGLSLMSLFYWVAIPLLKYFRLGKTISHSKAANIIGRHFPNVSDKLLNILQLKSQATQADSSLIEASINQKSEEIKPLPFRSAIDLKNNRQHLKYALPPFLLLLVLLFAAPSLIKDSSKRIINNNTDFERDLPFHLNINKDSLHVIQYDDFDLSVEVSGDVMPEEVFIDIDDFQYRLEKQENNTFSYTFKNVQKDTDFRIFSGFVTTDNQTLDVLEKPNIADFVVKLDYPSYTGYKDEILDNLGDLSIPQGTKATWLFNTLNTDDIALKFNSKKEAIVADRKQENSFSYAQRLMRSDYYKVIVSNKNVPKGDSLLFSISTIDDQYPSIEVEKFQDSLESQLIYFVGTASDDYGLTSVNFNYNITSVDGRSVKNSELLDKPTTRESQYSYTLDISSLGLNPGDEVRYYFEVFDNDAVNGIKSSKTTVMSLKKPTIEEFEELEDENEEEIKDDLKKALEDSKKLRDELKKAKEKLLQKKELDWKDKKELEKLLEKQKELEEALKEAKEKFEENLKNQDEFSQQEEEIMEKQEKLQEMFNEVLDQETQDLMKQIQELMEELNKDEMMEMMEEQEMDNETMEKEMDRLLELFKQLEVEKELKEQMEKLQELGEQQEELSEKTKEEDANKEEIQKEQEEINEKFEEIKEDLEKLEEKNEELEYPKDIGEDNEEKMEDIKDDMKDGEKQMEKGDMKKASKAQKSAGQKMKEMAGNLELEMTSGEMEQMEEDMDALQQLLENLVTISFDQEDLISDLSQTGVTTPKYVDLTQWQYKLKDDFKLVEDSLFALSKRVSEIEPIVNEKVGEIKNDISKALDFLEDRAVKKASPKQRSIMTNVNDLALMLDEAMQAMQQAMASMMPGNKMCKKPGSKGQGDGGNVPMDKITKGQEKLKDSLKKMMEGKNGQQGSSKEFAQAAARQAALRKALEELQEGKREQGKGDPALQEIIDQMDKIEEDLVNKRLNNELLKRQEDITTRLLEAENAERQREKDNKRKAEVGKEKKKELPAPLLDYLKKKEAEAEMYKTISPALRPYYRKLVDDYYNALKRTN